MSRRTLPIILVVLFLSVIIFLLNNNKQLKSHQEGMQQTLDQLELKVSNLTRTNENIRENYNKKINEIEKLNATIELKEDQIDYLKKEKQALDDRVRVLDGDISRIREQLIKLRDAGDSEIDQELSKELERLLLEKRQIEDQFRLLVIRRDSLEAMVYTLVDQRQVLRDSIFYIRMQNQRLTTEFNLVDSLFREQQEDRQLIKDLVENTQINLERLSLSRRQGGKGVISRNINDRRAENWRYTTVDFQIFHPRDSLLAMQYLAIKLYDVDRDQSVELREQNRMVPNEINYLVPFEYRFGTITAEHENYQPNYSGNYELHFLFR